MTRAIVTPEFIDLESPAVMRAMLRHILDHADIIGEDRQGRPILRFVFACPAWLMDKLAAFDARLEDLEPEPVEADAVPLAS